jgi:hypothetical protein
VNECIAKAVSIMRASPDLDDEAMYERLVAAGIERELADRLQAFLPMAYTRLMLEKSGVRFSDYFEQEMQGGDIEKRMLSSDPVWNASMAFARAEISSGITAQELFDVAGRSAECDAANQALNAGNKMVDLEFGACRLLLWPETHNRDFSE